MSEQNSPKPFNSFMKSLKNRLGFLHLSRSKSEQDALNALFDEMEHNPKFPVHTHQGKTGYSSLPKSTVEDQAVMEELHIVNLAIDQKYNELRTTALNERDEAMCIDSIQKLEMRRLSLLTRLHGQNIKGYARSSG